MLLVIIRSTKYHTNGIKKAAIELRKAGVSLSDVRTQITLYRRR
jgi:hypothetical protein